MLADTFCAVFCRGALGSLFLPLLGGPPFFPLFCKLALTPTFSLCNSALETEVLLWVAFLPLLRVISDIYGGCLLTSSARFFPNWSELVGTLAFLSQYCLWGVRVGCFLHCVPLFKVYGLSQSRGVFWLVGCHYKCFCFNCFLVQLIGCQGGSICDPAILSSFWLLANY